MIFDFITSILRTDSAPSRTGADRSSWVSASSISVAWRPHIAQGWFADFGIGQDILRYDRTDGLDFENLSTRLGVFKVLPDLDDTIIFARYEYQRITLNSLSDGNYNAQRLRAGLEKIVWSIPRQQVVVNLSGAYEWSAHPQSLERNEFSAEFAYSYSLTDSIYTVLSGKVYRFNYDQFGRDDWTYVLSTELIWQMNERCRASAVLLFDKNVSDTFGNFNEYEAWSGGLALGVELTF